LFHIVGPAAEDGLHLKSFRVQDGLLATLQLKSKYQAFPGIISGGIISALFDCHGNWTAAIALMDRAKLPRPPLTLTAELLVSRHPLSFLASYQILLDIFSRAYKVPLHSWTGASSLGHLSL